MISSKDDQENTQCVYFFKGQNTYPENLSNAIGENLKAINELEYWYLNSDIPSNISISWNQRSNLLNLTEELEMITLVGYHKINKQWEALAIKEITGTLTDGFLTSEAFIPSEYDALTLGILKKDDIVSRLLVNKLDNYMVSPNNDGINDFLLIPETSLFPENKIAIFDRNGILVFEQENYQKEFKGFGNASSMYVGKSKGLPSGVYFYVIKFESQKKEFQGFLYLKR